MPITEPKDCSRQTLVVWREWLVERIDRGGNDKLKPLLRDVEDALVDAPGYPIFTRRDFQ